MALRMVSIHLYRITVSSLVTRITTHSISKICRFTFYVYGLRLCEHFIHSLAAFHLSEPSTYRGIPHVAAQRKTPPTTRAAPMPKARFGWNPNSGMDISAETMVASACARFFKLLSAKRMIVATSKPAKAMFMASRHEIQDSGANSEWPKWRHTSSCSGIE